MSTEKIAVVVLGSHRSGTSIMTRVLALSGFVLPRTLLPPSADNPEGFWESSAIVELNDELLAMRDASWHDVFPPDDTPLLSNSGAIGMAKAEAVLSSEFGDAPRIVLKDPRISVLAGFWKTALARQGYRSAFVIMVRNPVDVSASLSKRDGFSIERGLLLWLSNMLAAERKSRDECRLFVAYDRLLEDPLGILDDLERAIQEPLPRRTRASELEVQRALKADLRHHKASRPLGLRGELERLVTETYAWFSASANGEKPDPKILDDISSSLEHCEEIIGGFLAEMRLEPGRIMQQLNLTQAELATARAALGAVAHDVENSQQLSRAIQAELAAANAALEIAAARAQPLEREIEAAASRAQQLESELGAATDRTLQLESELRAVTGRLETVDSERQSAAAHAQQLQSEMRAIISKVEAFEKGKNNLEKEIAELSAALNEERGRGRSIAAERDAALSDERARSSHLRDEMSQIQAKVLEGRRAMAVQEAANLDLTDSLKLERNRASALHADLELSQRRLNEERQRAEVLKRDIEYIQSRPWWRAMSFIKQALRP